MWASVVRGGMCASVEEPTCPTAQPAVSTADFSALYERCLASGFKARLMFSHAAGLQVFTVSCRLPTTTSPAATAWKRRRRRRRQRGHAATTISANTDRSPTTAIAATDTPAAESASTPILASLSPTPPSPQQPVPPLLSPEIHTPPAKRSKRRRRNEVELQCRLEREGELLLSPLSCTALPLPSSPPSPLCSHTPSTTPSPLLPPAPLVLEPALPPMGLPAPPSLPTSPPLAVAPSSGAVPASPPSPSPSPTPQPTVAGSSVSAECTIPAAPPISIHFPLAAFIVICRYCLRNSNNISYSQCPDCYKTGGGMNYIDW
jgi:hypothetical protein